MPKPRWPRIDSFLAGLRHAFALGTPLSEADRKLLARLAAAIVLRRMAGPAVLFLTSLRPLNFVGSQAMHFLRPFLTPLLNPRDYRRLAGILERREGLAALVAAIEAAVARRSGEAR